MKTKGRTGRGASLLAALLFVAGAARGADDPSTPPASGADPLAAAREHIAAKRWEQAVAALRSANETGSADWNNLMGFTARKSATPDLAAAERYYDAALRINPRHKGALEYSGELYLMKGDLARAEQRLQALGKECRLPCEEQQDLEKAIARFKADGNRYKAAE